MIRPPPLRATDNGTGAPGYRAQANNFTHDSVVRRLPLIVQSIIDKNANAIASEALIRDLHSLCDEIRDNQPLLPLPSFTPSVDGLKWHDAPWWKVENYFYKRILHIMSAHSMSMDPFAPHKKEALDAVNLPDVVSNTHNYENSLHARLLQSLWGNRADLSLSCGQVDRGDSNQLTGRMLVDQSHTLVRHLERASSVIIVMDNSGLEAIFDLLLGRSLVQRGVQVHYHVKDSPVFVSDVTLADFHAHVDALLRVIDDDECWRHVRSHVVAHPFYTTGLPLWEMPNDLRSLYHNSDVVVFKGDANYRRMCGDLHWQVDTPLTDVVGAEVANEVDGSSTTMAWLRTLKSGVLVGAEGVDVEQLPADFLTSGGYGVIQVIAPAGKTHC